MALKLKLTKAEFDKLPADVKAEYLPDGDAYKLDVDGIEDTGALQRAKQRETEARKSAEKKLEELETQMEELRSAAGKKGEDIAKLEKGWKDKLAEVETNSKTEREKLQGHIRSQLVDNVASTLANKLSKSPVLLLPHIKARLMADFDGDKPVTKVLGADGKPSALTLEQLEAEFVANKDFASIIVGSRASGGAGNRAPTSVPGGGAANPPSDLNLATAKATDLVAAIQAKKEAAAT